MNEIERKLKLQHKWKQFETQEEKKKKKDETSTRENVKIAFFLNSNQKLLCS